MGAKIFISWSGELSKALGEAIKDWIPKVLQSVKPYFTPDDIEKGATVLKNLADKIDTTRMKNPSFMMVLVGLGSYAYRRDDGVYVVPIGCLKP